MEHRTLGRTGMYVSPLCLGAMMFGDGQQGPRRVRPHHPPRAGRGDQLHRHGRRVLRGESEEIVGKALKDRRDDVVLATKVHGTMGDDPNQFGNSRRWIAKECDASLKRLGTDWIDLYQIHRPEPDTDIEETLSALTDLMRAGKVRAIGAWTFPPSQIVEAQWTAERRGRSVPLRAAALLDPRPRDRTRGAAGLPEIRDGHDPVEPARRRLADGRYRRGRSRRTAPRRGLPHHFDLSSRRTSASSTPP